MRADRFQLEQGGVSRSSTTPPAHARPPPHIALRGAGLAFTFEKVDLGGKKTESGADFTRINPKGCVPAITLDDGQVLTEASAILQYIAGRSPGAGLMPAADTDERHRTPEWLGFVSTELHKGFGPLWNPATADACKTIVRETLGKHFAHSDTALAGHMYPGGERFTIADAYAFTVMSGPVS